MRGNACRRSSGRSSDAKGGPHARQDKERARSLALCRNRCRKGSRLGEDMTGRAPAPVRRCSWAESDPRMRAYHDAEWGVPERDGRKLWEALILDGFQAGLSWSTILYKREAFRKAFRGLDPEKVARFGRRDMARLLRDPSIVRSRAKIDATIRGARAYLAMQDAGEGLSDFAWRSVGGVPIQNTGPAPSKTPLSEELSMALKERGFKFVGPVITYAWMQATGMVNDHAADCFRRASVQRARRG